MKTAIFDTNFWSYLASSGREKDFRALEKRIDLQVLLPPSILLEAFKTADPELRVNILHAMKSVNRKKMRTEADLETEELIFEIRRLRPEIRRSFGNTKTVEKLRKFWTSEIWHKCIDKHEVFHKESIIHNPEVAKQIEAQRYNKARGNGWNENKVKLSELTARFDKNATGINDFIDLEQEYELWRMGNSFYYQKVLSREDLPRYRNERTIVDWCEPFINIKAFITDKKSFFSFWLYECMASKMPRNWLRWAMDFLQPIRKIGLGNAYDCAHSSYLVDADFFFTSDKRYYDCLQIIYDEDFISIAKPVLLSTNADLFIDEITNSVYQGF